MRSLILIIACYLLGACASSYELTGTNKTTSVTFSNPTLGFRGVIDSYEFNLFDGKGSCPEGNKYSDEYLGKVSLSRKNKAKEVNVLTDRLLYVWALHGAFNVIIDSTCSNSVRFKPKRNVHYIVEQEVSSGQCSIKLYSYDKATKNKKRLPLEPWSACSLE